MKNRSRMMIGTTLGVSLLVLSALIHSPAEAANENSARRAQVISHWTAERRAAAIPRDLVIDARGLGYLRRADGSLVPHGHQISATSDALPVPRAKPGGGGGGGGNDSTPPVISNLSPGSSGAIIGASHTFSATVTDNVGVRSVTFVFTYPDGSTSESFSAANSGGDNWSLTVSGFTDGAWSWRVEARDTAKRGGNSASSAEVSFTVSTGGGSGGGSNGDTITNSQWNGGGQVQQAVGRLFFEMPSNSRRKGPWTGYVCSGTVVTDGKTGRSVILTASHCVYDDANNAFARNVLFIPDQAGTSGSGTDSNCGNDPIGCWVASFGVVDENWTTSVFPSNKAWDYAFYVVDDIGAHQGAASNDDALDEAVLELNVEFTKPAYDDGTAGAGTPDYTHGMGYSYSDDPNFMYCAEDMTTEGAVNWWLPSCGLSGGSSGGPWIQPLTSGSGPIISVNSWGYTTSPGMAGPILWNTSASCVYNAAALNRFPSNPKDGDAGYAVTCP
jgi:hypothetical protein